MYIKHSENYDQYYSFVDRSEAFEHYGKLGMKWGQRLYQYKDGSLTPLGRLHYGVGKNKYRKDELKTDEFSKPDPKYGNSAFRKNEAIKNVEKHLYRKYDPNNKNKDRHFDLDDLIYEKGDKKAAVEQYIVNIVESDFNKKINEIDYKKLDPAIVQTYKDMTTYLKDLYGVDKQRQKFTDEEINKMYDDLIKSGFKGTSREDYIKETKLWDDVLMRLDPNGNLSEQENYRLGDKKWEYDGKEYKKIEDIVDDVLAGKAKSPQELSKEDEYEVRKELIKFHGQELTSENTTGNGVVDAIKKEYGIDKKDLAVFHREIVRKDGKPFEYKMNGKTYECDSYDKTLSVKYRYDNAKELYYEGNMTKDMFNKYTRIESLDKAGYTNAEIAKKLGIPEGTVSSYLSGDVPEY